MSFKRGPRQSIGTTFRVVDRYSVGEYLQQVWDYPGAWYTVVAIPKGVKSREALIDTIVRDTLRNNW